MMFKPWINFSSSLLFKEIDRFFETYHEHPYQDIFAVLLLKEIDRFFETYPDHPHQKIFAVPHLRQELAIYVTNKFFDESEVVNDAGQQSSTLEPFSRSLEQQLQIEDWIYTGMTHVLQENADWVA